MADSTAATHISLIVTVKNEADAIGRLLDSIGAQSCLPGELVIADGGSHDATVPLIETWAATQAFPVRVLSIPDANISQGRNAAIQAARGDYIAATDAGVRLDPLWLASLLEALETPVANARPAVAGGFFVPDPRNTFEMAMSAAVLPILADIDAGRFLPSSRSIAFTKEAWQTVEGYPAWLDYCEDLVFDFALRRRFTFAFAPQAIAYFRPRDSLRSFFRQYYLYARGDGKADLWRRRHALRYVTYLVATPLLIALSILHSPLWALVLLAGAALYLRAPLRRLRPYLPRLTIPRRLYAIALLPVIRVAGDIAKMIGYPVGVAWRLTGERDRAIATNVRSVR
jgi:glycosyltransferase involved in cell wall biosynthesis